MEIKTISMTDVGEMASR